MRSFCFCYAVLGLMWTLHPTAGHGAEPVRPIALGLIGDGAELLVANRSGTVMRVDPAARQVRETLAIGRRLTGLAVLPAGDRALVTDEGAHELILLRCGAGKLQVDAQLSLGPYPVAVQVTRDGRRAYVSTLWSRRIVAVDVPLAEDALPTLKSAFEVRLPFAPRNLLLLPGEEKLLAADSFGGVLAVVDLSKRVVSFTGELPGHSIRGLALSPDGRHVLVAHQRLDETLATGLGELRSGRLTGGVIRSIELAALLAGSTDPLARSKTLELGFVGQGAADPGEIAFDAAGRMFVALSGTQQVAVVPRDLPASGEPARLAVGRRPTALVPSRDGRRIYVANTFGDSLAILDTGSLKVEAEIPLGPPIAAAQLHPRDRGEMLFFDARISEEGWMSCHTCHTDGHTNGRLADNFGDETFGTPKRILSLLGTVNTGPWGWRGKNQDLYDTIERSVQTTMHGHAMDRRDSSDMATFLLSLAPAPPLEPAITADDLAQVARGRGLFESLGCVKCHIPPLTYSAFEAVDVGMADEVRERKFNPPSLRGVGHGAAFFHDNRARRLEEVFTRHAHQLETELPPRDLADLLRYLRSL